MSFIFKIIFSFLFAYLFFNRKSKINDNVKWKERNILLIEVIVLTVVISSIVTMVSIFTSIGGLFNFLTNL